MIKKLYFIALFLVLSVEIGYSQNLILSGTVKDADKSPLPFANVAVYNADKSLQNGVITQDDGCFTIENLTPGTYTISVSYIGYITHEEIVEMKEPLRLPEIVLKEDAVNLQAVQVMGYRKLIKNENGRTTLNVEGSMLSSIPSATMIMSFVPGVTIQGEAIEVVGKGTPLLFIDGREMKDQTQLSSLQPERIKSITVDRNPSAKYDARYHSVVHIETVPTKDQEFSAQLALGSAMGNLYNHYEQININHSSGIWTNYLSYKYKNEQETEGVSVYQTVWNRNVSQKNSYNADLKQNCHLQDLAFGTNLKIANKHSVDLQYFMNKSNEKFDIGGTETLSGQHDAFYNVTRNGGVNSVKHTVNLNYRWLVDSLSQFNIFADYAHIKDKDNEFVNNVEQNANATDNYALNNCSKFDTYALRAEYSTLLFGKLNFNGGLRFSEIRNNAVSIVDKQSQSIMLENHSSLNERTLAAYTTLGYNFNQFSTEAGLRAECNESKYMKNEKAVVAKPRILNNLFPSLSLSYHVSDKAQLNLNYTSKINRPQFSDLDPSVNYLSSVLYQQGNPELKPETSHTVELGGTFWDNLNLSVGYSVYKNAIAYLIEPDADNPDLLFNRTVNLDKVTSIDLNTSYSLALGKWRSTLIGDISVPSLKYPYQSETKTNNIPRFQFVTTNTYIVSTNIFLMGNFVAQSRYSYLNNQMSPTYNWVLAANFVLLKGKMTLTVFGNDLLNRSIPNTYSEWGNVSTGQIPRPDSRQIGIVVKFNLNRFKTKFKQSESNSDVLKRIEKE